MTIFNLANFEMLLQNIFDTKYKEREMNVSMLQAIFEEEDCKCEVVLNENCFSILRQKKKPRTIAINTLDKYLQKQGK